MPKTVNFNLITEIAPDEEVWNWQTHKYDVIESVTSQRYFAEQLAGLTETDSVNLYINSMGGSVKEALGIYSLLQRCPATVAAYIDGFAASAASVIAMAADKVIMPRNTCMMIHNAAWLAFGNPAELRKSADDLEVINKSVINSYVMHAGDKLPAASLIRMLDAETWLTAEECVQLGLADELGEGDADLDAAAAQFKASAMAGKQAYAKAPDFVAALLQMPGAEPAQKPTGEPEPQTSEPQNSIPQAGSPDNNTGSIGFKLLKSLKNLED